MDSRSWMLLALFLALLALAAWPLARWMEAVLEGRLAPLTRVEAPLWRLLGTRPDAESGWLGYAMGLLVFNGLGVVALYALQRLQGTLPLNPAGLGAVTPEVALNTAISFVTNTNWQAYGGETTMSHLTQMLGLAVQNFLSAATGVAVVLALVRGFARRGSTAIGNVWVDLTRITLWVLLPLAFVLALALVSQGVVQTLAASATATTLDGGAAQTLTLGPVASQEAIKMLGTNGGGFFNANSAHPFENPTALANLLEMLAIFVIPAALCLLFGRMVGDARQGLAVLAAMTLIFVLAVVGVTAAEQAGNPALAAAGADQTATLTQAGGNMEGKEVRFGIRASGLFAGITTAASCGAVNSMHDSYTALGGAVPMALMQLGEVVFGGVGSGLYGMLVFAVLAVFIAGLMIGRTPEYLGKKIETQQIQLVGIVILMTPLLVLAGTALALATEAGRAGISNPGPHGLSQVLYALSSGANNNGSAFGGLGAASPFYAVLQGVAMWLGRFGVIVPVLALAGTLAAKPRLPATAGTLPTHAPLFVVLLAGTVLLIGLLNYVPALALGPLAEHLAAH